MKIEEIKYGISGIYQIIFDNDKSYIGLSNDIRRRIIEHYGKDLREHPELPISKAILKHKTKDILILERIDAENRNLLQEREKYWIAYYNTFKDKTKGYNKTPGGDGAAAGIYNNSASINQEQLDTIIDLLLNSNLTYEEIKDKVKCSCTNIITGINMGYHYRNNKYTYPLRKKDIKRKELENKQSKFYNNKELLLKIIQDLKNPQLSFKEISALYGISTSVLTLINTGKKYRQDIEQYPLRGKNANQKRIFSDEEMAFIKNALQNTQISMTEVAKKVHCGDRKVIAAINQGLRQKQENWEYPLRKNKI